MAKRNKRRDPIAEYIEWSNHRYDPGYYLGGKLPPYLRKESLSPGARRLVGVSLTVSALLALGWFITLVLDGRLSFLELVNPGFWALRSGWAGFVMLRSSRRKRE
jgi:hypothetical protein